MRGVHVGRFICGGGAGAYAVRGGAYGLQVPHKYSPGMARVQRAAKKRRVTGRAAGKTAHRRAPCMRAATCAAAGRMHAAQ